MVFSVAKMRGTWSCKISSGKIILLEVRCELLDGGDWTPDERDQMLPDTRGRKPDGNAIVRGLKVRMIGERRKRI